MSRWILSLVLWLCVGCIEDRIEPDSERAEDLGLSDRDDQGLEVEGEVDALPYDCGLNNTRVGEECVMQDLDIPMCAEDPDLVDCDDPACSEDPRCVSEGACQPDRVVNVELNEFVMGNYAGDESEDQGSCAGRGRASVYLFSALETGSLCINTFGSATDTVLYVRSDCGDASSEISCNDDFYEVNAALTLEVEEGNDYFVFVDQFGEEDQDSYQFKITQGECDPPMREMPPPEEEEEEEEEDCEVEGDEDENGLADCDDRACLDRPACAQPLDPVACEDDAVTTIETWGTYFGTTEGATDEIHGRCGGQSAGERVYRFAPPSDGFFCVDTQNSGYDTLLHIRKTCNDHASEVYCNDDYRDAQAAISVDGQALTSYFIVVDGYRGEGAFELTISEGACPPIPREDCSQPGDEDGNGAADCDDRACENTEMCGPYPPSACLPDAISDLILNNDYVSNNTDAPRQTQGTCAGRGREQVYRFTPEVSGTYCANTSGSEYDTVLYIRSECADPETELVCNDDFDGIRAAVSFDAEAQESYFIFADSFRGQPGDYTLKVTEGECVLDYEICTRPGDDDRNGLADCEDPACEEHPACLLPQVCEPSVLTPISTLGTYQGSTQDQTSDEEGSCGGLGAEAVYTFSIAGDSPLCLSTESSTMDTVLYVRTECGDRDSEIACNDDYMGLNSALTLNAEANVMYYLFVDSFGRDGDYTISLSVGACEPRSTPERCDLVGDEDLNGLADCDDPACADLIECLTPIGALACDPSVLIPLDTWGTYMGDSSGAPSGESGTCGGSAQEIVYAITTPSDRPTCVEVNAASFDVALYARSACATETSEFACDAPMGQQTAQVELNTLADVTSYVFVDGEGSGPYQLTVSEGVCPE